jgi:hypothetical protein
MIKFDLYISPNFRGGQHLTTFDVKDYEDLVLALKKYWNRSGLHKTTGEIFVNTTIEIKGSKRNIKCGNYVFDPDGDLYALSEKDSDNDIVEFWESLGVDFYESDEEELFEVKVMKLFNQEKPSNKNSK